MWSKKPLDAVHLNLFLVVERASVRGLVFPCSENLLGYLPEGKIFWVQADMATTKPYINIWNFPISQTGFPDSNESL